MFYCVGRFYPTPRGPDCEHVVNGLLPGHTYTFSLIACLNDVYGSSSPLYNLAVPAEPPNRPSPPRMATKSKTAITLRWTASADNGSPLDQYKLEWDQVQCGFSLFHCAICVYSVVVR